MTTTKTARERAEFLTDGCDHVETLAELTERIATGAPLRVYLGLDPTSADLHIGHAVVLRLLQRFVDDGHDVILLIGDFTARIGDPSGRNALRPPLSTEQIEANMQTYAAQAGKVLDMSRVTLKYNSEWLSKLTFADLYKLLSQTTVAQMLERNDFAQRYAQGTPIALHEFVYPVAVAYDSVAMHVDVELGGSDQLFNLLISRPYQVHAGQRPEICITVPLLEGIDGEKKMSKSLGNHIGLTDAPNDMFGKTMRIPDALIARYARLAAWRSAAEVAALERGLAAGERSPMDEKKRIAEEIVALYHGSDAAQAARAWFERTIQRGEIPAEMPELPLDGRTKLVDLIVAAGFADSKRAATRLVAEGGVRIDGTPVTDPAARWTAPRPAVLQVGSRKFVRVIP
ncbi:tyrosine--tRNA ligase [Vulcanimicrobium alpinum]|uniref:Tyrosine--tRNA ligase n=1 Tax=Vulcanimicrobium alpinum TaxID=3016050 RepID=A0AAN1XVA9_UNVUL|nr:tyrosine--tRNA ligase [Vulcanimicrobium alpinum]BDE06049.1 tyrosine--tRNA ligase [Vulcanimicrobium alpinum]